MHLPTWWTWWYTWSFFKFLLPIIISAVALGYVLYDRRPHLVLKARKGDWYTLREVNSVRGQEIIFRGMIEIYNTSARANAIRNYVMRGKTPNGDWMDMETEYSVDDPGDGYGPKVCNQTPLVLAPYSGVEGRVLSWVRVGRPYEMQIKIEVEDLFGNRYEIEVKAFS